eukprot:11307664-Ditylum_brightwellii.AAC.1
MATLLDGLGVFAIGRGEAGMTKTHKKTMPEVSDRGVTCRFVAYAKKHKGDCYEMWDPVSGI